MSKEINNLNKSLKDQLDLDKKQNKTDNDLATTDKTIVGAINELYQNVNSGENLEEALKDFQERTDDTLQTESKTIVGAINELFQSANNGKELIANAIGEPLNAEDTFSAMSDDINSLLNTFRTNMINNGVTVEAEDKFKQLIDKMAAMAEGKGVQYKSGEFSLGEVMPFSEYDHSDGAWHNYLDYQSINIPKDFDMNFICVCTEYNYPFYDSEEEKYYDVYGIDCIVYDTLLQTEDDGSVYVYAHNTYDVYETETGEYYNWGGWSRHIKSIDNTDHVSLPLLGSFYWGTHALSDDNITHNAYYAIGVGEGVGEEDTTLRDALASILQDKGIDVTEEDDMASLINKVNLLTMPN